MTWGGGMYNAHTAMEHNILSLNVREISKTTENKNIYKFLLPVKQKFAQANYENVIMLCYILSLLVISVSRKCWFNITYILWAVWKGLIKMHNLILSTLHRIEAMLWYRTVRSLMAYHAGLILYNM
jgi:hypothetical protein